jgi:hypothetical protein
MNNLVNLNARIRDRLTEEWLTPSERSAWTWVKRLDAPPHRVINVYGGEGTGKTFLGWLMERQNYASYASFGGSFAPTLPRMVVDDAPVDRSTTREFQTMVDSLKIKQIILLTRSRVDEPAMPAFDLKVESEDIERFRANLYRYINLIAPEGAVYRNYQSVMTILARQL